MIAPQQHDGALDRIHGTGRRKGRTVGQTQHDRHQRGHAERGVGQVEPAHLLRKQIESVIREYGADPAEAALAVCVILDGNLGLAEDGYFDDDEFVLNAILAKGQADD